MRISRLDPKLTVCLDALLFERNVSRAAARIFVSQPAMSVALRRLREYFGDELLTMSGKTRRLTPLPNLFRSRCAMSCCRCRQSAAGAPTSTRPSPIAKSPSRLPITFPQSSWRGVFERAYQLAPRMRFDLRLLSAAFLDDLDSGEIDLLIIPDAMASSAHPSEVLFRDTFSCVVCNSNPVVRKRVTLKQYLELGHVISEWDGGRLEALDERLLAHSGYKRRCEVSAPSFSLTPQLVTGTPRIATIQTRLAKLMARQWPIRVLPCPLQLPSYRRDRTMA